MDIGKINLMVKNSGWGNADNITVSLSSTDINLEDYIKPEKLQVNIPLIESSKMVEVPFLTNDDLLIDYTDLNEVINLIMDAYCVDSEGNEV